MSSPGPPLNRSRSGPPKSRSFPRSPRSRSWPLPPRTTSLPLSAWIESSPAPAQITSRREVPVSRSSPGVPMIVHAGARRGASAGALLPAAAPPPPATLISAPTTTAPIDAMAATVAPSLADDLVDLMSGLFLASNDKCRHDSSPRSRWGACGAATPHEQLTRRATIQVECLRMPRTASSPVRTRPRTAPRTSPAVDRPPPRRGSGTRFVAAFHAPACQSHAGPRLASAEDGCARTRHRLDRSPMDQEWEAAEGLRGASRPHADAHTDRFAQLELSVPSACLTGAACNEQHTSVGFAYEPRPASEGTDSVAAGGTQRVGDRVEPGTAQRAGRPLDRPGPRRECTDAVRRSRVPPNDRHAVTMRIGGNDVGAGPSDRRLRAGSVDHERCSRDRAAGRQ